MKGRITHEFPWYRGDFVCEPLPIAMPLRDNLPAQNEMGITGKYVLFLGNIEPRKNIVRLVRAYENLPVTLRNKYSLVLAGGVGWNNDEIAKTIENSVASGHKVITTGYVSEKQRASLYKNASVFAFPSLYEGYGLPVLEAASYGVPVVASDLSVLREVMGQGAAYCDPMKTSSITETLRAVLESKAVRARLVDGGSAAVSDKSWDRVAKSIYKRIGYSI
jgi:alpha-1,3-rhamnosyl/mannosyltransferase